MPRVDSLRSVTRSSAGRRKGGNDAKDDRRAQRECDGEEEDTGVDLDFGEQREGIGRVTGQHGPAKHRRSKSERAAYQGQQHGFGQQLSQQAGTARAERAPDRELPSAADGAAQLQVGDVGADDEEEQADRRAKHQQRRARFTRETVVERLEVDAHLCVRVRVLLLELMCDAGHVFACLLESHPWLEARDDAEPVRPA